MTRTTIEEKERILSEVYRRKLLSKDDIDKTRDLLKRARSLSDRIPGHPKAPKQRKSQGVSLGDYRLIAGKQD